MSRNSFDLMVIGGGPAGYVAAIRASQLGFRTAVVEKECLGGACLNWGCIPTKALLHGAEIYALIRSAGDLGFQFDNVRFDIGKLVEHSLKVRSRLTSGINFLLKKNNIALINGRARLIGDNTLAIDTGGDLATYSAGHIVLATGARSRQLPSLIVDGEKIWGPREAINPAVLPSRMLVVGGGAIGVEFASLYHDLGSKVTLVEMEDRILPAEDHEISGLVLKAFRERGIIVSTSTKVQEVRDEKEGVSAVLVQRGLEMEPMHFDKVIVAIGVVGNIEDLGLEDVGVSTANGFVNVDDFGATNIEGIYAIGDVAGPPWIAHKASRQGIACVERIAGLDVKPLNIEAIPLCTYCRPQVASIGLTESQAVDRGYSVRIGRSALESNGKAIASGEASGLVKTIFDERTGELIGAHMIGHSVSEQIQGFSIGKALETTEAELLEAIFPHPTISESIHESVLDAFGRSIHH